ncbi:hypothetical protein OOZ19_04675 [Saccharopolyspora sp. NFXS83]|uniref:hypothetical protein n=1 Tax=Saccharopolyspora sp. NFXS83 TaxID=2993560 RepID=UPI00224A7ACC|nr:hypothetical protein [Saccharopolyspora sp. NFXS83]MCX2729522.1 hypothetical protein [Saccharopolyspora sp. NFXS83]
MTNVLIQPCANTVARRNWRKTIDQSIQFRALPYSEALTAPELERLNEIHDHGAAKFWGRTGFHDKTMPSVRTGDVVLFTWKNHIRAIGTVGTSFRNSAFGDMLWHEPGDTEVFPNVFSLLAVAEAELPYSVLWSVPGIKHGDNFRQGRVITDLELADDILDSLGVQTAENDELATKIQIAVEEGMKRNVTLQLERLLNERTQYQAPARAVTVNHVESRLVHEYEKTRDINFVRVRSSAGVTDLQTSGDGEAELIEAKGDHTRKRVREAVAQLLHYAPENTYELDRLTALFPARPGDDDITYLHRLGIDCVHRTGPGSFKRDPAPEARREYMRPVWNDNLER